MDIVDILKLLASGVMYVEHAAIWKDNKIVGYRSYEYKLASAPGCAILTSQTRGEEGGIKDREAD
jgi:hypothetical protein